MTGVLITRPQPDAKRLSDQLVAQGFTTHIMPTLQIDCLPVSAEQVMDSKVSAVIFLSQHAVSCCPDHLLASLKATQLPVSLIAIGPATQIALQRQGFTNAIMPGIASSEGVFDLLSLANVPITGRKVMLVCGENARPWLSEQLQASGAIVKQVICYQRRCPTIDADNQLPNASTIDVIICTSCNSLDNLYKMLTISKNVEWLTRTVLVVSQRIKQHAEQLGFTHIIHATAVSDQAIIQRLNVWHTEQRRN